MAVTEPPGDFDYLWDDLGDTDDDPGFDDYDVEPDQPPPVPWYRTTAALLAICAIVGAVIAILVAAVLLASRTSRGPTREIVPAIAPTPSSTPATGPPMIATVPPTPTESPSPTAPTASAPVIVAPTHEPSPTAPPRIGVTRSPISVRPEPHPAFPHY